MESVVRFVLIHRRVLAALLVGLAVWSAIAAITRSPDTRPVWVAARDLDSGAALTRSDLQIRRIPAAVVPSGTVEAADITGRTLSGGMRAGEVFTNRRVVDPRDVGDGRVLAVVEVPAATGDLLRAGDAVDLLAVGEDKAADTIAEAVDVITIHVDTDRDSAVLGVSVEPKLAAELARVSVFTRLAAVVVARG